MKKFLVVIISFFLLCSNSLASTEKLKVQFSSCVDGDTAKFITENGIETVRFLAIDTPEYTTKKEVYGKEASNFTCNALKNANKIELELDTNSDVYDRYDRLLAWVWVDGILLQKEIVKEGLSQVAYLYGDYKYTTLLQDMEKSAKTQKLNIWSSQKPNTAEDITIYTTILTAITVILLIILKKYKLEIKIKLKQR